MIPDPGAVAPQALRVGMSDGAELSVLRCSPADAATDGADARPRPAVVTMTPYGKHAMVGHGLTAAVCAAGYEAIVADVRGMGASTGRYDGILSPREVDDYVELLAWVAAQPFCDGQTALVGASYGGANQLLVAARRPDSLRCIAPAIAPIDFYRDWVRRGGIPSHASWGAFAYTRCAQAETAAQGMREYYERWMTEPFATDGHAERSPAHALDRVEVPTLLLGGWHDYFVRATVAAFAELRAPKRLVVSTTGHDPQRTPRELDVLLAWLAWWLRGEGADQTREPAVLLSDLGDGSWASRADWPAADAIAWERWSPLARPQTLAPVTVLHEVDPPPSTPPSAALELATDSGMRLWGEQWTADGPPVSRARTLLGPLAARLVVAADGCSDVDAHVRCSLVRADGAVEQLAEGRLRASQRALDRARSQPTPDGDVAVPWHPHASAEALDPGTPAALEIGLGPLHATLAAGERLRIGITLALVDGREAPAQVRVLPESVVLLPWSAETAGT